MANDQEHSDNSIFMSQSDTAGRLLLVRHGEQVWPERLSPLVDWIDPPLSEFGQQQADAVGKFLANAQLDAVYSSSLQRAKHTAAAIAEHHDVAVPAFEELDEVRMFSELPQDLSAVETLGSAEYAIMHSNFGTSQKWDAYLHGERSNNFRLRVTSGIQTILDQHQGSTIAIVCHGGVLNAYLSDLLGLEADIFFRPKHCSVSQLRYDKTGSVIDTLNEYGFLTEAGLTNNGKPNWE